jgi:hypothetical protein
MPLRSRGSNEEITVSDRRNGYLIIAGLLGTVACVLCAAGITFGTAFAAVVFVTVWVPNILAVTQGRTAWPWVSAVAIACALRWLPWQVAAVLMLGTRIALPTAVLILTPQAKATESPFADAVRHQLPTTRDARRRG